MQNISAFANKTRGRDTVLRVRGSHDFHRVILDFKKESPGSVLLLSRAEYSAAG